MYIIGHLYDLDLYDFGVITQGNSLSGVCDGMLHPLSNYIGSCSGGAKGCGVSIPTAYMSHCRQLATFGRMVCERGNCGVESMLAGVRNPGHPRPCMPQLNPV